jgi:hypothetical protein
MNVMRRLQIENDKDGIASRLLHASEWLPERIAEDWRCAVNQHLLDNPFLALEQPNARAGPLLPYGSTVLAALVVDSLVVYLQLGDGDILLVSADGEARRPWKGERQVGLETASLCAPDASRQMQVKIEREARPELILLSTDGYANSFRQDSGFLQIGGDLLHMIREDGMHVVENELEGWLAQASAMGSGDDVTLAGLYCTDGGYGHGNS